MSESSGMRIYLISAVGIVQLVMLFFTIRMIMSRVSNGQDDNYFYFKEKKDNIYGIFQVLMYILLITIFRPGQGESINVTKNESRLLLALGVLGLINTIAN